jgi:hypothetical protein
LQSCKTFLCAFSLPILLLSGCAGSFDSAALGTTQAEPAVSSPPISGSVYGGHAPIVSAKVYILTPSTTANAGASTSLMSSTSSTTGGFPVTQDTSGGITNGMYYVTSDSLGNFNLTGDYTCTVNRPVYIVAVGGRTITLNNSAATISSLTVGTPTGSGSSQTATVTFTASTTELYFIGETLTLSGFTGNLNYLNSLTPTVLSTNLTTTTFAATISTWNGSSNITGTYTGLAATSNANPPNNPAIVNMAALGVCPSNNTFAGHISYIYMNEISTAALAFAAAPFGTDAFHIGVNQSGTLNTTKIPGFVTGSMLQAFNNASLLYDITGSNLSTSFAGEGHIARLNTPAGNGLVPQARLDTIGNILAACVDSANTSSSASLQCSRLFSVATADGTSTGTQPADIAAAAFNIARFPAGTGNSSFISTLYTLPAGNIPFTPALSSAPTDFTLGIQFKVNTSYGNSNNLINNPQIISLDGQPSSGTEYGASSPTNGVWIGSYNAQPVKLFTNGTPDYTANASGIASATRSRSLAVDSGGNIWIMNEATGNLQQFSDAGTLLTTIVRPVDPYGSVTNNSVGTAIDASGNLYANYEDVIQKTTSAGTNIIATGATAGSLWSSVNSNLSGASEYSLTTYIDSNGLIYVINNANSLCVANASTAVCNKLVSGFTVGTSSYAITFSALDAANTFWSTNFYSNNVVGYNYSAQPSSIKYTFTGGGLNQPAATAIDGAGNIWVANAGNASLSAFTPSGTALSPTAGFGTLGFASTNSADLAIDRAGDVWVVYSGANYAVEMIGLATPAVSPTAFATFNGLIGQRPF